MTPERRNEAGLGGEWRGCYTLTVPVDTIEEMLEGADEVAVPKSLLRAVVAFFDQAARGETENPQRYADTFLKLDDELRSCGNRVVVDAFRELWAARVSPVGKTTP